MKIQPTDLPGVLLIEPDVFVDHRGFFFEAFNQTEFNRAGLQTNFVQDNYSRSCRGTLRGLHYQVPYPQDKLVWIARGEVFDVVVDLRRKSSTFGRWISVYLSEANHLQLFVPAGFAHGFCVTSDIADVIYKCTDFYRPTCDQTVAWNDPQLAVSWPIEDVILSPKDRDGRSFADACYFE
jgi:dTDP-4-dehydrorhamnose 3,5-epimerase